MGRLDALREAAKAADGPAWWSATVLADDERFRENPEDAAFIEACTPMDILHLLDERADLLAALEGIGLSEHDFRFNSTKTVSFEAGSPIAANILAAIAKARGGA